MNRQLWLNAFLGVSIAITASVAAVAEVNSDYRLFTTATQRSSLDGLRSGQVAAATVESVAPRKVDKLTYSGYYVSPQGEMRYWLNGEDAQRIVADDVRVLNVRPSGVMTLYRVEGGEQLRMRAGQSLSLDGSDNPISESAVSEPAIAEPAASDESLDESAS